MSLADTKSNTRQESISGGLRAERHRRKISANELAAQISVNPSTIWKWESGETAIDVAHFWEIADIYGMTLDELAGHNTG